MQGLAVDLVAPCLQGLPGQEAYVRQLARRLPALGLDVRVRELCGPPRPLRGETARTLAAWASYPRVRPRPGALVHGTDTFCALRRAHVVTVHDLIPLQVSREPTARLHHALFGRRLRRARRILVPTRVWARRVEHALRLPPGRVQVIPQGYDEEVFRFVPGRPPSHGDGPVVLVVGAYRPYKRIRETILACAPLGVRVVRIGPLDRGAYARSCRAAARRSGCAFVDLGRVPEAQVPRHMSHADLLVYASREEGFGLPPLEAMACGTASVLSPIPVFREVYGGLARYAAGFGVAELRAAIRASLEDPLPRLALQRHAARFTWQRTALATAQAYREVAEEGGLSPLPLPPASRTSPSPAPPPEGGLGPALPP